MEPSIFSLILLAGGIYFLIRNFRLQRNPDALRKFMQSHPAGKLWIKKYGLDGATQLAQKYFLPLGLAVSVAMIGLGACNLLRMYA